MLLEFGLRNCNIFGVEVKQTISPDIRDGEADPGPGARRRAVPQPLQGQGARPQG